MASFSPMLARLRRLRGFTLVELAIAMSILGLMVGLGLQPMKERLRNDDLRETRALLARAGEAVVSYALSRRAEPRQLRAFGTLWDIPEGRPYLPCPDVDGDGLEDRRAGGAVANPLPAEQLALSAANATANRANGHCLHYKGLLPWRKIGGPAADLWGTHLTYRVDPHFANAALGFDAGTRAETSDLFAWLAGGSSGAAYPDRDGANGTTGPAEICLVYDCRVESFARELGGTDRAEQQFLHDHKVGLVVVTDEPEGLGRGSGLRPRARGDILEAPAFVILSHGENRLGGVSADSGQCAHLDDDQDPHELQNAFYYQDPTFVNLHPLITAGCYTRLADVGTSGEHLSEAVFVERPPAFGVVGEAHSMDDVLTWMSANELIHRLSRTGELPPPLEFAREAGR